MASKILPSENAPSEVVHYSFAGVEFDLGGSGKGSKKAYETDDVEVLGNAEAHPWLKVERETVEVVSGEFTDQLNPADDALSAQNSVANDPEAVKAAAEARESAADPTAIDAGLDQDKVVETGGVNETLAADDKDSNDKDSE